MYMVYIYIYGNHKTLIKHSFPIMVAHTTW